MSHRIELYRKVYAWNPMHQRLLWNMRKAFKVELLLAQPLSLHRIQQLSSCRTKRQAAVGHHQTQRRLAKDLWKQSNNHLGGSLSQVSPITVHSASWAHPILPLLFRPSSCRADRCEGSRWSVRVLEVEESSLVKLAWLIFLPSLWAMVDLLMLVYSSSHH